MVFRVHRNRQRRSSGSTGTSTVGDPRPVPLRGLGYEEGRQALRPVQAKRKSGTKLTRSKAGGENTSGELLEMLDRTAAERAQELLDLLTTTKNDKGGDGFMAVANLLSGPDVRVLQQAYDGLRETHSLQGDLDRYFGTRAGRGFLENQRRRSYVQSLIDGGGQPSGIARLSLEAGLLHPSHALDVDALVKLGHQLSKGELSSFIAQNLGYLNKHGLFDVMDGLRKIGHREEGRAPRGAHESFLVELVKRRSGRKKLRLGARRFDRDALIADLEAWADRDDVPPTLVRRIVLDAAGPFRQMLAKRAGKHDAKLVVNTLAAKSEDGRVDTHGKTDALLERSSERNRLRRRTHRRQTARQIEQTLFPKGGPDIEGLLRRFGVLTVGEAVDRLRGELEESKTLSKEQIDRICLRLTVPKMSGEDVQVYQDLKALGTSRRKPHHLRFGRRALKLVVQLEPKTPAYELVRKDKALVAQLAKRSAAKHWKQIESWLGVADPGGGGEGNTYLDEARAQTAGEVIHAQEHPQEQQQEDSSEERRRTEAVKRFAGKIRAEVTKRVPDRGKVYRLYFLAQEESKLFNGGRLDLQFIRDIDDIVKPWKLGHMRFSLGETRWQNRPLSVEDVLAESWGKIAGLGAKGKTDVGAIEAFVKAVPGEVLRDKFFNFDAVKPDLDAENPAPTRTARLKHVVDLRGERKTELVKHVKRAPRTRLMAKMRRRMAKAIDAKPELVGAWYTPDEAPLAARQVEAIGRLQVERLLQSGKQFRTWSTASMGRSQKANAYVGELRSTRQDLALQQSEEEQQESLDSHVERLGTKRGELKQAQKHFEEKRALYQGRVKKAIALIAGLVLTFLGSAMGIPAAVPLIQFLWGLGSGLLTTTMRLIADRIIEGDSHESTKAIAEYVTAFLAGALGHVAGGVCWYIDSSFAGSVHYSDSEMTKIFGKPFLGILKTKAKGAMGMPSQLLMHYAQSTHPFRNSANDAEAYVKGKARGLPENLVTAYTNGLVSLGLALGVIARSEKLVGLLPSGIRSVDPNKDKETWKKEHNVFHDSDGAFGRSFFGTDPNAQDQGMGGLTHSPRGSGWLFDGDTESEGQGQIGTKAGLRLLGWDAYTRTTDAMTGQVRKGLGRGVLGTQVSDQGVKGHKQVGQRTTPQQNRETAFRRRAMTRHYGIDKLGAGLAHLEGQAERGGERRKDFVRGRLGSRDQQTGLYARLAEVKRRVQQDGYTELLGTAMAGLETRMNTLHDIVQSEED